MNKSKPKDSIITDDDLPALFKSANNASLTAQRWYLALIFSNLLLMIAGAALSAFSVSSASGKTSIAICGGISFGVGLILTTVIGIKRYEREWYGGRAVAESVKTLSWRYMTRAEPYISTLSSSEVTREFASNLSAILSERKYLSGTFGGVASNAPQITDRMKEIRNLNTEERKYIYVSQRIANQREWYSSKAEKSQNREQRWFIAVIVSQILALASAFYLVGYPEFPLNLTGIFSTFATAFLAWLQIKRHQELAQSYGIAAQELGLIAEEAQDIHTEEALSKFVSDSESAISREHTLWVARRDTV